MSNQKKTYPVSEVLILACSAHRFNGGYVRDVEFISDDNQCKLSNKIHILYSLGDEAVTSAHWHENAKPVNLIINDEDRELAGTIKKYFKRLIFSALAGDDQFRSDLNAILEKDTIESNMIGFLACLPKVYERDNKANLTKKKIKDLDNEHLGAVGTCITNKKCEVLDCSRSKNFDAYNILAIIDNKLVTWMCQKNLILGDYLVKKAKIKDLDNHWKYSIPNTRLNYVKVEKIEN